MTPMRLLQGHSTLGVWTRIVILQAVVSFTTVLVVLAIQADPNRDAINNLACGLRGIAQPQIDRAQKVLDDPTSTPSAKKRNEKSITQIRAYLAIYHTVPINFKCPQPDKKAKR